ncbi:MAG: alpha/beta hydrolase [Propionibacteriaceae bacterium]|nr:alpha/beta hydrolase [Propionibacteriaceae bacterium]
MTPTQPGDRVATPGGGQGGRLGWIVAGSLAAGLLAAILLVVVPFVPATEDGATAAILIGFASGWALLAGLSALLTDQPQRWAWLPALFLALSGAALLALGESIRPVLNWVWPPALLAVAIVMIIGMRRQQHSRGRWMLYPVIAVIVLSSVGGGAETVGEALDANTYPPPGRLISVGDHSLHLSCTGTGGPTVVLEPGSGEMSSNLGWITPAVAAKTRVCVYDRAGRGWSESAATAQDGNQISTDLHTLLQRGNVPGPYILAGHSFGGLYVLAYAARYPDEVAGMVLIDSTAPKSPGAEGTAPDPTSADLITRLTAMLSISARLGLGRLYGMLAFDTLPARSRDEVRASMATAANLRSGIDEFVKANTAMRQAGELRDFGDKPLVVLTAGVGSDPAHLAAQDHLATMSTNSVHRTAQDAAHEDLVAEQGPAAITSHSILDVVTAVRTGKPLVP